MQPPAGSRRSVSCHRMRVSLYVPFVLLCALLMSACASEEEQAREAREAQQEREEIQKSYATDLSTRINGALSLAGSPGAVAVECPDTLDRIVRLGCEARAGVKRVRIKVARTGEGDFPEDYRVVTKFVDKSRLESIISSSLRTSVPTRFLLGMECPELVEKKKGVRFVCKGYGAFEGYSRRYTVRARFGFNDDGGEPIVSGIQHMPALSP